MLRLIHAHWMKTKNTSVRILCVSLPVIYSLILFFYFYSHQQLDLTAFDEYRMFFLFFTICALFTLSIVVPLLLTPDMQAGNLANELRIGVSRTKLFVSRFLFTIFLVIAIELLATTLFSVLEFMFLNHVLHSFQMFVFMGIVVLFLCPLILCYQLLALRFYYSETLLAGIFFTLSGILLGTTDLGTFIWQFLPWVWPIRLIYYEMSETSFNVFSQHWELTISSLFLTFLLMVLGIIWYNQWEGKMSLED